MFVCATEVTLDQCEGLKIFMKSTKRFYFIFKAERQKVDEGGELAEPLQVQVIKIN